MAHSFALLFKLSLKVVLLVFILSGVADGTIKIEDGRKMGNTIISEGLRTGVIQDYRTSELGSYGILLTEIRNLAVSNVRLTDSTTLTLEDHNTINVQTPDLSLHVRADWTVDLQSYLFSFVDAGTISYNLNAISINIRYTFENRDRGLPPIFRQASCQATVLDYSSPLITATNSDSWLYAVAMNILEEDLKGDVREEICNMLDPVVNLAVNRKLSSYSGEFLPKCPDIPNAILIGCSMTPGDICSVICTEGYILHQKYRPSIRCSQNNQWNVEIDSLCEAITCENSNGACTGEEEVCVNDNPTGLHCECGVDYERSDDGSRCVAITCENSNGACTGVGEVCVNDNPTGLHCECGVDYERSDDGSRCVGLAPPLEFVSQPEDVTFDVDQTVQMSCQVNDEEATYYWFKGDRQLLGDVQEGIIVLPSMLIILNVDESDSGTYSCVARNSRGQEVRSSSHLTVTPRPATPSTPVFLERPVDRDLIQGNDLILPCRVDDPSAVITWYKNDILIEEGVFRNIFLAGENGLLITDADFEHQGTYKCVAINQESVPAEASAILAFPTEEIFETKPSDALVLVDEDHILTCSSQNPTLTVRWLKDGSPLVFSRRILKLRGRVFLRNVVESDAGVYTCVALDIRENQVARISAQVTVLFHGLNGVECGTVTSSEVLNSTEERSSSGRIVGGQDAVRGSAPWMARLYVRGHGHLCGGSLIDRQWVVTAAHCFHGVDPPAKEDLSIRLGDHGVLNTEQSETLIQVEEIHEHEEFDLSSFDNDIALIKLVNPLRTYNDYIRPICLANRTKDRDLMIHGTLGRVNGWGRITEGGITPEYLTEVYIPLVKFVTCKKHFRRQDLTFTRNMFCAGHPRGGADACQGDSGGPYSIMDDTGRWYLTGLVSWGQGCGRTGQYGSYTRYSKYHGWIQRTINMME